MKNSTGERLPRFAASTFAVRYKCTKSCAAQNCFKNMETSPFFIELPACDVASWLQARGKLPKCWSDVFEKARSGLRSACTRLPDVHAEISTAAAASGQDIDGATDFLLVRTALDDWLSGPGKARAAKTLFGRYTDESIDVISKMLVDFRKERFHIVDMSEKMSQLTDFAVPKLKGDLVRLTGVLVTLSRRRSTALLQLEEARNELAAERSRLGCVDVGSEDHVNIASRLVKNAASTANDLAASCKAASSNDDLHKAIQLYADFTSYASRKAVDQRLPALASFCVSQGVAKPSYPADSTVLPSDSDPPSETDCTALLGDVVELRAFLAARIVELTGKAKGAGGDAWDGLLDPLASAPAALAAAACNAHALRRALAVCQTLFSQLSSRRVSLMYECKAGGQRLSSLVDGLLAKAKTVDAWSSTLQEIDSAKQKAITRQSALTAQLAACQSHASALAAELNQELSRLFSDGGRVPVVVRVLPSPPVHPDPHER